MECPPSTSGADVLLPGVWERPLIWKQGLWTRALVKRRPWDGSQCHRTGASTGRGSLDAGRDKFGEGDAGVRTARNKEAESRGSGAHAEGHPGLQEAGRGRKPPQERLPPTPDFKPHWPAEPAEDTFVLLCVRPCPGDPRWRGCTVRGARLTSCVISSSVIWLSPGSSWVRVLRHERIR